MFPTTELVRHVLPILKDFGGRRIELRPLFVGLKSGLVCMCGDVYHAVRVTDILSKENE